MRLIIAGPRDLHVPPTTIQSFVEELDLRPSVLLNGGATGVDQSARNWRELLAPHVKHAPYPAPWTRWKELGLSSRASAGPWRNEAMAQNADELLIIKRVGESSPGTNSMHLLGKKYGLTIYVREV